MVKYKYQTQAGMPTKGLEFSQMIDALRQAQEHAIMLSHLTADEDKLVAQGWLAVSEMLKLTVINVTKLATKGRFQ
jgi:hypothetical protein